LFYHLPLAHRLSLLPHTQRAAVRLYVLAGILV
jgi:hypothetical protein